MTLRRLGALRFVAEDQADFDALPIDATLIGATVDRIDTGTKFVFDGSTYIEFEGGAGGGGITGLEPNSTILEYLNSVADVFDDYTTPTSVTATSSSGGTIAIDLLGAAVSGEKQMLAGDSQNYGMFCETTGSSIFGITPTAITVRIRKEGLPTGTLTVRIVTESTGAVLRTFDSTLDVSTLTTSIQSIQITDPTADHVIAVGEAIVIRFAGGDGSNKLFVDETNATNADGNGITTRTSANNDTTYAEVDTTTPSWKVQSGVLVGFAEDAIDGNTTTFWASQAGINESITLDMGSEVNMYGLAYFLSTDAGMTETQFQIKTPEIGATFFDDFTSYADQSAADLAWVPTDITLSRVNITTDVLGIDEPNTGSTNVGIAHDLVTPLSDTEWLLRFKINFSTITTSLSNDIFIGISDSDQTVAVNANQDALMVNWNLRAGQAWGASSSDGTQPLNNNQDVKNPTVTTGTDLFVEIKRISAISFSAELFSDSGFSISLALSTGVTSAGVTGLRYIKVINRADINETGQIIGTIDDVTVFDNSTVPVATIPAVILRTINVSDMTLDAWNFIRFNGINSQTLTVEGSSGSSLVMAANELAVQLETDPPLITKHGQFTINGTNANLPFNGGDPTSSVIEDPSTNSLTLLGTVTQNDPVTGASVLWTEPIDGSNDGIFTKIKVANSFAVVQVAPITGAETDPTFDSMTLSNTVVDSVPNPPTGEGVFFVETIDANNDGVFCRIKLDGIFQKVRVV